MATLTRGATVLTTAKAWKRLQRHAEGGPSRVTVDSLAGTPIVVEYPNTQARRRARFRIELLTEAEAITLRAILDGVGPLTFDPGGGASAITGTVVDYLLEAIIGDYPANAPAVIRYHRAELELAILTA